mmetsp:Transcript_1290/g.2314  ORF Transcript_1290/g.2314 Transcript_1290/m.2314 type:complete len:103 (+) Transcript_1290:1814-2122(+)
MLSRARSVFKTVARAVRSPANGLARDRDVIPTSFHSVHSNESLLVNLYRDGGGAAAARGARVKLVGERWCEIPVDHIFSSISQMRSCVASHGEIIAHCGASY